MLKFWREFKAFAVSGNVLDLALGFLIGAAFAKLVESLANNVLMQLVAAVFGKPDFTQLSFSLNGARIKYGAFLTDTINFMILAFVMFAVIKLVVQIGIGQARSFVARDCPYCITPIPTESLVCKQCGRQLVDELPSVEKAQQRLAEQRARRGIALPRRRQTTTTESARE
ncbi:MAG TPA: large conductance mechanosensitive channel protein MscL [Micromonosporaceae bacterium]|nr:large conductance mechanosensitive channel protein MscL [Micromonosporaceae bacterium]